MVAATRISAALDNRDGVKLDISAPEATTLLTQLGAPPLFTPQRFGPAHVTLDTSGEAPDLGVTGKAELGTIHGDFSGAWREGAVKGDLTLAGDPASLIGGPTGEGQLKARVEASGGALQLRAIEGARGDNKFSGDLALSSEGVSGALKVERFSAPAFVALVLGAPEPVKSGAQWSSLSFAPVLVDPPHAKLSMDAADVAPFGAPARFELTLGPNLLGVAKIESPIGAGFVRGGFELRRQAGQATLSGEIATEKLAVKNSALAATLTGKLKFAASGGNMAALIGSLSGAGAAHVADFSIAGAAPEAPAQVLVAQAASEALFDTAQTEKDLDAALAKGDAPIAEGDAPLHLAEGKLKAARDPAAFTYDLNDLSFALTTSVVAKPGRGGVNAEIAWSGPWTAPQRKLDATAFVTLAATRALERERIRIARQREEDRQRKLEAERQQREAREKQKQLEREQRLQQQQQLNGAAPQPASAPQPDPAPMTPAVQTPAESPAPSAR